MKIYLIITALFFNFTAFAETAQITIEGMHCGGCKKMVIKKVCADAKLSENFEKCEITSLDTKKQIGILEIKYKANTKPDLDSVETAIIAAGEDYKVSKKEILKENKN